MKRFYCIICQKVRRVRRLPYSVSLHQSDAYNPVDRIGECAWHSSTPRVSRPPSTHKTVKKTKQVTLVNAPRKQKKAS